jgi:hypothetical protein
VWSHGTRRWRGCAVKCATTIRFQECGDRKIFRTTSACSAQDATDSENIWRHPPDVSQLAELQRIGN